MQSKKIKTLLIFALLSVAVAFASIGLLNANKTEVKAQIIQIDNVLDSEIALNTQVDIASSISVEHDGATHTANNGVVVFPDGKIVNAGKIRLNQAGVYQLRYFFDYKGITYTAVQNVEVYSSYFNLSNPNGGEIIVSDEQNKLYTNKDGVIVKLKSGTSFVYNKVLDLRNRDEDGLSTIIEMDTRYGHFENGKYVRDVTEAWIRLTDCYNPNIYMDLRMQNSETYSGAMYPGVKTNTQAVTGMDKGETYDYNGAARIILLDGINYRVWSDKGSMNVGLYNMSTALSTGLIWKYDMDTKRVYLTYNGKDDFLVSDLDEPIIYPNGNLFEGFTTGEVYVSVFASGYTSTYAHTEIISIGNDNLKDVVSKQCTDEVAPVIVVDKQKTTATGVWGAIGDTFTIPEARAIDVNLIGGVDVAVYRGYGTNTQINVSVQEGKFVLSEKDLYTIVYTARDKSGNEGKQIFTVATTQTPDNRAITLDTAIPSTVGAGKRLSNLYQIDNSINLDKQDVQVKVTVQSDKQNLVGYGSDFTFTPYYEGKYTVKFEYTDGIFNYEKAVSFNCEKSSNVCFMDEIVSPKYYIQGNTYAIENITAYEFTSGSPKATATSVYAVFDNGAEQLVSNPASVEITGSESVYFIYRASSGEQLVTQKTTIINADYYRSGVKSGLDMSKLFIGNFESNALNSYGSRGRNITYTSNVNSGNNTLSYFNAVSGRKFAVKYKTVAGETNFKSLRINLTDAVDSSNKLVVELFKNSDATYYSINGGNQIKADLIKFEDSIISVSYDYESKFVRIGSYSDIVEFNASKVYLSLEMVGITGKSSLIVTEINNTPIAGNTYKDTKEPEIYVQDFQGDYSTGDVVEIMIPEFSDVLSGIDYSRAKLLLTCSDGQPVLDKNGNQITNPQIGKKYEILLDRIAIFYAIYEVYDFAENQARKSITINCADTIAPTVTLGNISESETLTVKKGEEIIFEFTVADNLTVTKKIITYIHLYCNDMFSFVPNVSNIKTVNAPDDGVYRESFVIPISGNYTAQIHAIDEVGNVCVKYIKIVVE